MKDFINQLEKETRKVDFDSFDISVKELVSMSEDEMALLHKDLKDNTLLI